MPVLAFGLKLTNKAAGNGNISAKRKAFDEPEEDASAYDNDDAFNDLSKPKPKLHGRLNALKAAEPPPRKSPKLDEDNTKIDTSRYSNLSAFRSAKLQDAEASQLDSSVYDYDAV